MSALEQAAAVRLERSPVELTQLYLDRIAVHNDRLNAFSSVNARRALKAAKQADRARQRKGWDGGPLFHGVPTGIKDLVPMAWTPTKLGSRAYKYMISPFDAPVVKLIRAGGFISLGKLATSEFGVLPVTEPDVHPPSRNPWDLERTPGGSSGGSSAAVAADLLPIAHGSDGGGSVRIPSALCHLFGFKPSITTLGNLHGKYNRLGISVMGPLARYVEDAAAMIDVMAGRPYGGPMDVSSLAAARREPGPLKIAMFTDSPIGSVDPEIQEKTHEAADFLRSLGHTVVEADIVKGTLDEFLPVWRFAVSGVPSISESVLQPVTRWHGTNETDPHSRKPRRSRRCWWSGSRPFWRCRCALVAHGVQLLAHGEYDQPTDPEGWFEHRLNGALTATFNLTTGPAASLPLGLTEAGLPYGFRSVRVWARTISCSPCASRSRMSPASVRRPVSSDRQRKNRSIRSKASARTSIPGR